MTKVNYTKKATLKFPVLNKVEYFDLVKNRVNVLSFTQKEIPDGTTWRDLQLLCGDRLPSGVYNYGMKFYGDNEVYRGSIKAVSLNKGNINMESPEIQKVTKLISDLQTKLLNVKSEAPGVDMLLQMTRQGYDSQISILKDELTRKEKSIDKLELKVDSLETELQNAGDIITDLKKEGGLTQYIQIAKDFLTMKSGNARPIESLANSNTNDIPGEVLEVLGVVDWPQVDPVILKEIIHYLKVFIQKLPMKGI